MAVGRDQGRARENDPEFGTDHVNDALIAILDVDEVDTGLARRRPEFR
jgi:hypothetical protein